MIHTSTHPTLAICIDTMSPLPNTEWTRYPLKTMASSLSSFFVPFRYPPTPLPIVLSVAVLKRHQPSTVYGVIGERTVSPFAT